MPNTTHQPISEHILAWRVVLVIRTIFEFKKLIAPRVPAYYLRRRCARRHYLSYSSCCLTHSTHFYDCRGLRSFTSRIQAET